MLPRGDLSRRCSALAIWCLLLLGSISILPAAQQVALHWAELPSALQGRTISVVLADGATVNGQYLGMSGDVLSMRVTKTSDPGRRPKGPAQLPKQSVAQITTKRRTGWKGRTIGLITGGAIAVVAAGTIHSISNNEVGGWSGGSATAAAIVGSGAVGISYLIGWAIDYARSRPERVIRILPDAQ